MLVGFSNFLSAQMSKNNLYIEIGGNSGFYSLNYDKLIDINDKLKFALSTGFSTLGSWWFSIPMEANLLWSKKENAKNFLELCLGTTYILANSESRLLLLGRFGYRHQKPQGGFMCRFSLNIL